MFSCPSKRSKLSVSSLELSSATFITSLSFVSCGDISPWFISSTTRGMFLNPCYSCGLSTATIKYSSPSVCLSVCVHDNSKNNGSIDLKLEHIVVYENSSDEFDIGLCPIKVKVMV